MKKTKEEISEELTRITQSLILSIQAHPDYVSGEEGDEWHDITAMANDILSEYKQISQPSEVMPSDLILKNQLIEKYQSFTKFVLRYTKDIIESQRCRELLNEIDDIEAQIRTQESQLKPADPVQRLKDKGLIESGCAMDEINKICDKAENEGIDSLIEDYQRRLKTICPMIASAISRNEKVTRLDAKASCYRTFITELERIRNNSDNQ